MPDRTVVSSIALRIGADHSARSAGNKIFAFIFSYQDELSWHFRTLKTRKRRFQTICSHRSPALSTVATAAETIASPPTSSQNHAAESGSKRAGAPCHQSQVLAVETNTSQSLKNTKVEENSHNLAIQLPEGNTWLMFTKCTDSQPRARLTDHRKVLVRRGNRE